MNFYAIDNTGVRAGKEFATNAGHPGEVKNKSPMGEKITRR
jgi:hypothetical protein